LLVVVAFTAGKRLVVAAVTASHRMRAPHAETSVMMALVVGAALLTQLIGVHLVLGAFMMSILLGRAPRRAASDHAVRTVGLGFFVPFFFAYTGIKVDLTALRGSILAVTVVAVGVACVSKLAGGWLGGLAGGLQTWEAAAGGVGLNARGAMELVIAAIGLSIGVLTPAGYSIIVVIAVVTTLMAGPMLRFCLSRVEAEALPGPVEATVVRARIDRPQIRQAE
jgi:Kef-type K+ transport system membrane component KefB